MESRNDDSGWEERASDYSDRPALVVIGVSIDLDNHGVGRQEVLDFLGPFDKAQMPAGKILLVSHVEDLVEALDAVKIEMVNGLP